MAQLAAGTDRTIGDYGRLARRRWKALAAGIIVGLLLAIAYLSFATPTYVSSTKVLVRSVSTDVTATGSRTAESVNLDTEAQLVTSFTVAELAADTLDYTGDPVRLPLKVSVTVPPNTTVLTIAYADSSAAGAQEGADAFAQAYLDNRTTTAQESTNLEIDRVRGVIDQLTQQLQTVKGDLTSNANPPTDFERTQLLARRDTINVQRGAASVELTLLQGTVVAGGEVISDAEVPKSKTSPNPILVLPSGLMGGLLVGIALSLLGERVDERVHTTADVERRFAIPVLVEADASRASSLERSPNVQHEMRALYGALRPPDLRTAVVALLVGARDATADELAGILASLSARSGSLTTLVRRDAAANDDPASTLSAASAPNIDVLDYRSLRIVDAEGLRSQAVPYALGDLRQNRDVVLLGLPTGDRLRDLPALSHSVDVVVVVVELGLTRRPAIRQILGDLARANVRQIVAVTVRPPKAPAGRRDRTERAKRDGRAAKASR